MPGSLEQSGGWWEGEEANKKAINLANISWNGNSLGWMCEFLLSSNRSQVDRALKKAILV